MLESYRFLAMIDLIQAKAQWAEQMQAFEPTVQQEPTMDWIRAIHPLLQRSLKKQDKQAVPLDIRLEEGRGNTEEGKSKTGINAS